MSTSTSTSTDSPNGGPVASPITFSEEEIGRIAFNRDGLVGAIVQDAGDGTVPEASLLALLRATLKRFGPEVD